MKFEKLDLDLEKYQTLDIITASPDPANPTTPDEPTNNTDPYEADKW